MSPERRLLIDARRLIDARLEDFICIALKEARTVDDELAAYSQLRERIEVDLEGAGELTYWLRTRHGIRVTSGQARLCRLAWIDRMLQDYP